MDKVAIFKNDNGGVSVIHFSPKALQTKTLQDIAVKSVPAGKPFAIVDKSELPSDRSMRDAWTVDEADLTDGVGE